MWAVEAPAVIIQLPGERLEYGPGEGETWDELYIVCDALLRAVLADRHNAPTAAISGAAASAAHYRPGPRRFEVGPGVAKVESVADGVETRRVSATGIVHLSGLRCVIGRAFAGEVVKVRPLPKQAGIAVDFRGWPLGVATDAKTTAAGDAWAYRPGSTA